MIFIGLDGVNVEIFQKLLLENKLPNFQKIISNNGVNNVAQIAGHTYTSTAPGNSELHTGLSATDTGIFDNDCNQVIPDGKTIFERLKKFNPKIVTGSIYGKNTCYLPHLLENTRKSISWWQDGQSYEQNSYGSKKCTNSIDVSNKTLEFLNSNKNNSFYLFVYFGETDCIGHKFGVPSSEYNKALVNIDEGLGILISGIRDFDNSPNIIISGDHGWNINTKGHSQNTKDTSNIILISNNLKLIEPIKTYTQCDIAPTILNYFGMNPGITDL